MSKLSRRQALRSALALPALGLAASVASESPAVAADPDGTEDQKRQLEQLLTRGDLGQLLKDTFYDGYDNQADYERYGDAFVSLGPRKRYSPLAGVEVSPDIRSLRDEPECITAFRGVTADFGPLEGNADPGVQGDQWGSWPGDVRLVCREGETMGVASLVWQPFRKVRLPLPPGYHGLLGTAILEAPARSLVPLPHDTAVFLGYRAGPHLCLVVLAATLIRYDARTRTDWQPCWMNVEWAVRFADVLRIPHHDQPHLIQAFDQVLQLPWRELMWHYPTLRACGAGRNQAVALCQLPQAALRIEGFV